MQDSTRAAQLAEVVALQAAACRRAGSQLYGRILDAVAADTRAGGGCWRVLATDTAEPLTSALPLRLLGALHRIVLEGRDATLAGHYPSVGGGEDCSGGGDAGSDAVAAVARHERELVRRLGDPVQTNEVGRSAVLVGGFAEVFRRTGLPLRILEVGASAGLNLRWDRYWYDTGRSRFGDPSSPVRFGHLWEGDPPDLSGPIPVADRRGCDRDPVDPASDDGRLSLLSYVWPDQQGRIDRLVAALEVARTLPVPVDRADAPSWLDERLGRPVPSTATVVVHTIVLQYLSQEGRARLRAVIEGAGERATVRAPVAWLRMEPAGARADVRLTCWPGGREELVASAGYHGEPIRWLA